MESLSDTINEYESYVYLKMITGGPYIYLFLYAYDVLIASKSMYEANELNPSFNRESEINDLCPK